MYKGKRSIKLSVAAVWAALAMAPALAAVTPTLQWDIGRPALWLREDGSIWSWNAGPGAGQPAEAPRRLGDGFVQARAGADFVVGLREDGSLWSWGQLGDNRRLLDGIVAIDTNDQAVIALNNQGQIWGLGTLNMAMDAWNGLCSRQGTLQTAPQLLAEGMRELRATRDGFMAIGQDGRLWAKHLVGDNTALEAVGLDPVGAGWRGFDRLDDTNNRVQASDGNWYALPSTQLDYTPHRCNASNAGWNASPAASQTNPMHALVADNAVLWQGSGVAEHLQCVNAPGKPGYIQANELRHATVIPGVGFIGLRQDGRLVGCGASADMPFNQAPTDMVLQPTKLNGRYTSVAATGTYSLGVDGNGTLWGWGNGSRLGDNALQVQARAEPTWLGGDFQSVAAGPFNIGLKRDGSLWLWGGYRGVDGRYLALEPIKVDNERYRAVVSRQENVGEDNHLLAQRENGEWRKLPLPRQGNLDVTNSGNPPWEAFPLKISDVSPRYALAIGEDGQLWTWMDGAPRVWSELGGEGPFAKIRAGAPMAGYLKPLRIAVVGRDGRLWLSRFDESTQQWPALTQAGTDFADVRFYQMGLLGLKRDGSLHFWDASVDPAVDTPISLGQGFQSMALGSEHLLLTRADGELWGMGSNQNDQLGLGNPRYLQEPTVLSIDGSAQFSATTAGPINLHRLSGRITPAATDVGRSGYVFVGAKVMGLPGLFSFDGQTWQPHPDGVPGPMGGPQTLSERNLPLAENVDLRQLIAAEIWLGYGVGDNPSAARADMQARGLWRMVHRLQ